MTQDYIFEGTCKYAFVTNPNKYGNYSINFYPKDDATRKAIKATGTRNGIKEDEDGFYYVFRAPDHSPPAVMDKDGNPFADIIGTGSTVRVKIELIPYKSAQHGDGLRTELVGVVVENLVPYAKSEPAQAEPPKASPRRLPKF